MRRTITAALAALTIAACSGSGDESSGEEQGRAAEAAAATTTEAAESTTTTTASPTAAPMGASADYRGASIAVHAFEQPVAEGSPAPTEAGYPADYVWAGLDVEVCAPPDMTATVSPAPWALAYPDGALLHSSHSGYQGFPQPQYPFGDQAVSGGQCVRGWIVFASPGAARPSIVQYAPQPGDTPIEWAVQ